MFAARRNSATRPTLKARMNDILQTFIEKGDLAHLALFLWASGASGLLAWSLRELAAANRRFDAFVREIARFNQNFGTGP